MKVQRAGGTDGEQGVFNEMRGGPAAGIWQTKERLVQSEVSRRQGPDHAGPGWPSKEFGFYSKHNRRALKDFSKKEICLLFFCALRYPFWKMDVHIDGVPLSQLETRTPHLSWGKGSISSPDVIICGYQVAQGPGRKEDAQQKSCSNQDACLAIFNRESLTPQTHKKYTGFAHHHPGVSGAGWGGKAAA